MCSYRYLFILSYRTSSGVPHPPSFLLLHPPVLKILFYFAQIICSLSTNTRNRCKTEPPYINVIKRFLRSFAIYSYLTYKDECLFVPYTNPHFWTNRNQTLTTSPPWSGRDRRVCTGPQYLTFPTFSAYFVGSGRRTMLSRWLPAPHYPATALYPWCGMYWCDVTHGCLCNENAEKWTECVWKWKHDETGRKWLMNCTCNYIAFIQTIT
jgi:hypothetical protein